MTSGKAEIRLFNTLTKSKDRFDPIDEDNVRMYVCGPTVYDYAHIGNARPAIVFDVLYRLLRHTYGDEHVTYVRNITDVDDKINARAVRDFPDAPLNEAIAKVTEKTTLQYQSDMKALGCLAPDDEPRATAHIPGMVKMIQTLIDKGNAYIATGDEGAEVLFDTRAMPDYGKLSRRRLDEQLAGARVAVEAHKKDPADFVLWKQSSDNQPGWDGAFTFEGKSHSIKGRPGWHIECSVMSEALLGETFDIHGGGLDLIFPHHENELAQSRCAHGKDVMANVWMHNGFLQVEGEKMSKSLGNFYTVNELLAEEKFGGRSWPGPVLRLAMLMTHYREPIDFTFARLDEAERTLREWIRRAGVPEKGNVDAGVIEALWDDLNFSRTKVALEKLADAARPSMDDPVESSRNSHNLAATLDFLGLGDEQHFEEHRQRSKSNRQALELFFYAAADVGNAEAAEVEKGIEAKKLNQEIEDRLTALSNKDFSKADEIRDDLLTKNVQLMDYKDPETGERKTKWEVKR